MGNVTVFCFLASYSAAFGLEWTRLLGRWTIPRGVTFAFAAAGLAAHTAYLYTRSVEARLPPLLSSAHDWMLVLAWIAILFYLFLTTFDRELAVGLFLLPLVLLLIGAAYFVSYESNAAMTGDPEPARRGWAMLHAALLVFGIAGVMVGFVLSMMYLVQHRRLKHKQTMQRGLTLPSLEKLARLNWWAVMVSVPLLTLGLGAGVVLGLLTRQDLSPVSFRDPVVIVSAVVWLVMAAFFVWLSRTNRPAGKQVAWLTLWAFGFLLVTLVGLQVLTGGGMAPLDSWHGGSAAR